MDIASKKTMMVSGLILAALVVIGSGLDSFLKHENLYKPIGLAIGLLIMAYMVYSDKTSDKS